MKVFLLTPTIDYDSLLWFPVRSKILVFNNFVSYIDVDQFPVDPTVFSCNCGKSSFLDEVFILTRDLRLINNNRLRKIICKGSKYCEHQTSILLRLKRLLYRLNQCISFCWNMKGMPKESISD